MRPFLGFFMPSWHWLPLITIALYFGCSQQETYIPPLPAPVETHAIASPDFVSWSGYPVGTQVVRYKEVINTAGVVKVTTTLTLKEKSDEQVVVESQISVVRPDSSTENPPQTFEFPVSYQVPVEMKSDTFDLPSPTAKKTGQEMVQVSGHEFEAEIYEWEGAIESGKVDLKLWRCASFPGRQIRMLTDYRRDNGERAVEETIELTIPVEVTGVARLEP